MYRIGMLAKRARRYFFCYAESMQIDQTITSLIERALEHAGIALGDAEITLEHPNDLAHGDYSCNVAMVLAKRAGTAPRELAERILAALPTHTHIAKAEVAGAGFINFYLSDAFFTQALKDAQSKEWGRVDVYRGEHMLIEHSSPNLFKPFHIGHLVNNTYGEALVRIARNAGARVTTLSFPSDVSPGIAKAIWWLIENKKDADFSIEDLGEAYALGSRAYKEDEHVREKIDAINGHIYTQNKNARAWKIYEHGRALSLEYFKKITARLGSHFDGFIFESEAEKKGVAIVRKHTPGVFEMSDSAIIFRGSQYGLFDNVYINAAGFGTYLAKDTGLLAIKEDTYDFDTSIVVTDIEQKQHFELVKKSAELVDPAWAAKTQYLQHGRLALTSGRISSRDGGVPLASDILDGVKKEALAKMKDADEAVAERLAIGAVKYAIAKVSMGKNITFDLERSLSLEGDSGPYLQYTHARCYSVLRKAGVWKLLRMRAMRLPAGTSDVERILYRFPEVVTRAAYTHEPHHVANYLNELASAYNRYYAQNQILDGSKEETRKLALTYAVSHTLKNGLALLGITAPERM